MDLQSRLSYQVKNTKNVFSFKRIEKSDKDVNFYTGLKNAKVFLWVVKRIEKHVTIIHKKLSLPDHVLIVLMKIKLALLHQDIGYRFNVKAGKISQIWRTFVPVIAKCLKNFIAWPDRGAVRKTLIKRFEKKEPFELQESSENLYVYKGRIIDSYPIYIPVESVLPEKII